MKFFPIVWRNLLRRKIRTIFTLLSVFVAFILFGILMAIRMAFSAGVTIAGAERLVMIDKISLINPIPLSYQQRIQGIEGVKEITHANWFGGVYQEPKNFFANMAVEPESWLKRSRRRRGLPTAPARSSASTRRSASAGRSAIAFRCRG
jgi:putative ABC transport system permease protein